MTSRHAIPNNYEDAVLAVLIRLLPEIQELGESEQEELYEDATLALLWMLRMTNQKGYSVVDGRLVRG